MRWRTVARFDGDFARLRREHRAMFRALMPEFSVACDGYVMNPGGFVWPARLRVARMVRTKGIWEMTWSFSGPDGRATFQFVRDDDGIAVLWRRIGDHAIYVDP